MPPIEKTSSVVAVAPIATAQRGQVKSVARVDAVTLQADGQRKSPLHLDVPLSSFVPPLEVVALKTEGSISILMPPNEAGVRPIHLVDGPNGPAIRLELDLVDPGAIIKIPITFDVGNAASLSQVLHLEGGGDVPVSAGRFKCQIQLRTVAMDRTAPALMMATTDLRQANEALVAQQKSIEELQNQTAAGTSFRQLENQLANAKAVLASITATTNEYQQTLKALLRQQPPSAQLTAASYDSALFVTWEAFRIEGSPANAAAWSNARDAWLTTASEAERAFVVRVVAPGQVPQAPRLSVESANAEVVNLTAELEQRRASVATASELPKAIERLAAVRANRDKIAATLRAFETGTTRDVVVVPTSYAPSSLLFPSS